MTTLYVAIFGAVGVVLRYRFGLLAAGNASIATSSVTSAAFPAATLGINVSGTFVLAALLSWASSTRLDQSLIVGISVGLLGGFTTFSAFGWETLSLLRDGRVLVALAYVTASVGCSLIAAWLAWALFGSG